MPDSMPAPPPPASGSRRAASSMVQSDLWAILQAGRWFSALPPVLAEQLRNLAKPRLLVAGEWLFRRGDPPCGLYAVARGALTIAGTASMGEQTRTALLTLVEPPMWLGEIALFDQAPRSHDAYAATHCTLLHIAHQPLRQWLEANPQYWRDMALLLTDKLRNSLIALEEQTVLPAPQRLAHRLVQMAHSYGQWNDGQRTRRELAVSQEQLARMLGLSRQTANQVLQELQQAGLLQLRRGKLEVLDLHGLRAAACHGLPATGVPATGVPATDQSSS